MPVHENTNAQRHQPPGRRPTGEAQRFGLGAFSEYSVFPQFVKLNRAAGSLAVSRQPKAAGFSTAGRVGEIVAACGRGRRQGEASVPLHEPEWDEFHDHTRQSIESLHSGFKDDGKEVVASSGRSRSPFAARSKLSPSRTAFALTPSSGDEIASGTTPTQRSPRATRSSTSQPAANSNHRFEPKSPTSPKHRQKAPTAADRRIHRAHNSARSSVNRQLH